MVFKFFILALLFITVRCVLASENLGISDPPEAKPLATYQDIHSLRSLINKEFGLQSAAIENKGSTLIQLKVQGNALDQALQGIEVQQSIVINNLRFFAGALSVLIFLQIIALGLLNKKLGKKISSPATLENDNANKADAMACNTKLPLEGLPITASTENILEENTNPLMGNGVSISNIKVDKATLIFEESLPIKNHDDNNHPISMLLAQSRKIKTSNLEKLNNPKSYSSPLPLRLSMRPITELGNKHSLVATLIRNKIFSTRKGMR